MQLVRSSLVALATLLTLPLACSSKNPCSAVSCEKGQLCDPADARCKAVVVVESPDASAGSPDAATAPADASVGCSPACSGATPYCELASRACKACLPTKGCDGQARVCDPAGGNGAGSCVICSRTEGCGGTTPHCDTSTSIGACVACQSDADCTVGACDVTSGACLASDAGTLDGSVGGDGGALLLDGGATLGDGGSGACGLSPPVVGHGSCSTECARGFSCVNGSCILNGGGGPVQITLRFDQAEDLDLHVLEPLPAGGSCEIYYLDPNDMLTGPSTCGAVGSLDLDSNAGCVIDNVDTENVIYPPGAAPKGTYKVLVDYYQNCSTTRPVPFEIVVRNNGVTTSTCGSFQPADADAGGAGSGKLVTTFVVP